MKGLLTKDLLVITKQMKLILFIIPVMAVTGGTSIASIAILLGAFMSVTAFAYDEQSKWNDLAVMMPYSTKDIVLSKYLLGYLCMAGVAILFVAVQLIISMLGHGNFNENLFMLYFSILSGLLFIAINIPIMFRFGTQKGRIVFIIFVGLMAAVSSIIRTLYSELSLNPSAHMPMLLFFAAIILNIVSIIISLHIKKQ